MATASDEHELLPPGPEWMDPDVARAWHGARTLADLGELTAQFLEGKLGQSPSHMAPPDPETTELIPLLASVNRAGFVTHMSQPGGTGDGWEQRADVSGFAGDDAFTRLLVAAAGADLIITAARAGDEDGGPLYVITRDDGEDFTWDGGASSRDATRSDYSEACSPEAADALTRAWQVTLIDPQWGRNDHLWPVLEAFVTSSGQTS